MKEGCWKEGSEKQEKATVKHSKSSLISALIDLAPVEK